jgi:hypothetical protein
MVDPDHNPLVLQDCPDCAGRGQRCLETSNSATLVECLLCQGVGTTWSIERYFVGDAFDARAATPSNDWLDCPWCHRHFSLRDGAVWSGLRHLKCGGVVTQQDVSQPIPWPNWRLSAADVWRDGGSLSATLVRASQCVSLWLEVSDWDRPLEKTHGPLYVSEGSDPSIKQARVPPLGEAAWRAALSEAIACSSGSTDASPANELLHLLVQRQVEQPG